MTLIPIGINQADPAKNLTRAIIAMQSSVLPAGSTLLVLGAAAGNPPVRPILSAATSSSPGVKGLFNSFWIRESPGFVSFTAEIPYSIKLFARDLDLRKSIVTVAGSPPVIKPLANPTVITGTPTNLEEYIYDQFVALKAAGGDVNISREQDVMSGRTFIQLHATVPGSIDTLLAG
jgi:hypothetical protein